MLNLLIALVFLPLAPLLTHAAIPQEVTVPKKLRKQLKSFEPSGALYLPATDSYLIASDDTDEDDSPMLFLMSRAGEVEKKPVTIHGLDAMTDIESLSTDGTYVYALSSQGRNKHGEELAERNQLVRGSLEGNSLAAEAVELRPQLLKALAKSADPRLQAIGPRLDKKLDIEASLVREGRLLVGLKDPQPRPGVALVLDLGPVDSLFGSEKLPTPTVAFELAFAKGERLSDLVWADGRWMATTSYDRGGGNLWEYSEASQSLTHLQRYEAVPEGLAFGRRSDELLVVFDQGESGDGLFAHERLGASPRNP